MSPLIFNDAQARPDLFQWNGRMSPTDLKNWLNDHGWQGACPPDLLEIWQETGGGDLFETETILGPLGNTSLGDDIVDVNRALRSQGMPERFLVFYIGIEIGAVDTSRGDYVALDTANYQITNRFFSFDDWYVSTLRLEFKDRYGLP